MTDSTQIISGRVLVKTEILGKDDKIMIVKVSIGDDKKNWDFDQYLIVKVNDAEVNLVTLP